jgi:hypothetical protein
VWYFQRRHKFPISKRLPLVVIFEFICFTGVGLSIIIPVVFPYGVTEGCTLSITFLSIFLNLAVAIIAVRVHWLWRLDFFTKMILKHQKKLIGFQILKQAINPQDLKTYLPDVVEDFLVSRLKFLKKRIMFYIVGIIPSVTMIAETLIAFKVGFPPLEVPWHDDACKPMVQIAQLANAIQSTLLLLVLGFFLFPILVMRDNFQIGQEMQRLMLLELFVLSCAVCLSDSTFYDVIFRETRIWSFVSGFVVQPFAICIQGYYPLWLTIKHEREKLDQSGSLEKEDDARQTGLNAKNIERLRNLLADDEGVVLFQDFLKSEFSVENLMFYEACETYQNLISQAIDQNDTVPKMAASIFENFVVINSPFCVNISHKTRKEINDCFTDTRRSRDNSVLSVKTYSKKTLLQYDSLPKGNEPFLAENLFSEAQDEILRLMASDSFLRFKMTPEYKAFSQRIKTDQVSILEMQIAQGESFTLEK